jgi:hypothetical protein
MIDTGQNSYREHCQVQAKPGSNAVSLCRRYFAGFGLDGKLSTRIAGNGHEFGQLGLRGDWSDHLAPGLLNRRRGCEWPVFGPKIAQPLTGRVRPFNVPQNGLVADNVRFGWCGQGGSLLGSVQNRNLESGKADEKGADCAKGLL